MSFFGLVKKKPLGSTSNSSLLPKMSAGALIAAVFRHTARALVLGAVLTMLYFAVSPVEPLPEIREEIARQGARDLADVRLAVWPDDRDQLGLDIQ